MNNFDTPLDQIIQLFKEGTLTLPKLLEAKNKERQAIIGAYKQGEIDREDDMLCSVRTYESGDEYYALLYGELNMEQNKPNKNTID